MAIVALPGTTVQLPCALEEEFPGELSWREMSGKDIPSAVPSSLLFIGSFNPFVSGNYTCHLESAVGMRVSAPVQIRMYCELYTAVHECVDTHLSVVSETRSALWDGFHSLYQFCCMSLCTCTTWPVWSLLPC